jgi:hypothetical protein
MLESTPLIKRKIKVLHLWRQYLLPTEQVFFDGGMEGLYTILFFSQVLCVDENWWECESDCRNYFAVCQGIKMSMKKNVSLHEYIQDKIPVIWVSIHVVFFLLDSSWWRQSAISGSLRSVMIYYIFMLLVQNVPCFKEH